jgi:aldose 1-epimerase
MTTDVSRASIPPSGRQYEIRHGEQVAAVVEVGGGVREYRVGERAVLDPYPLHAMCDGAHGCPLVPWPNRLADGRYRFDGVDYQVAITEPDKGNAIHGFLRWRCWNAVRAEPNRVTMAARLHPLTGYPFLLDVEVDYRLDDDGGVIDDAVLTFTAGSRIVTDPTRQLPTGVEPVAGGRFDFSEPRRIGDLRIDFAFTDLARDEAGLAWVRLQGPDGRRGELWVDRTYPIVELYTGDTLSPDRRRLGLGAEPMTCPPNAFQSGQGVHRIEPGGAITTRWGARLRAV